MKKVRLITNNYGFTFVEIIVALSVFLIIIPPLLIILWNSQITIAENTAKQTAVNLAAMTMDHLRQQSFIDFNSINDFTVNNVPFQTTVTTLWPNLYTKHVTVDVSWQNLRAQTHHIILTTLLTDTATASNGNTCFVTPSTNHPLVRGSLNFGDDNKPTGIIVRNDTAFVTTNSATFNEKDFYILNVSDANNPIIMAALHTGPGLSSIAIKGNYVLVGNTSINTQLQIIDISVLSQPTVVTNYKLPGSYTDNTTIPTALTYYDNTLYLGTQKSQIGELHIIDINNITTPQELSSVEINAGVNALGVTSNIVYLASPTEEELKTFDVSDKTNPRQVGIFNASGGSGNGKSLSLWNNTLFLGRTIGNKELYVLKKAGQDLVTLADRELNTSINDVAATPSWLYLATTDTEKTLQIWDITALHSPILTTTLSLNDKAFKIACGKNQLYLLTEHGLTIVTP